MSVDQGIKMRIHFIDILAAYLVCSYVSVTLILLRDGSATFIDWILGLTLAPVVAIIYVPIYTFLALVNRDYLMFARGMFFMILLCVATWICAYMRYKIQATSY